MDEFILEGELTQEFNSSTKQQLLYQKPTVDQIYPFRIPSANKYCNETLIYS